MQEAILMQELRRLQERLEAIELQQESERLEYEEYLDELSKEYENKENNKVG